MFAFILTSLMAATLCTTAPELTQRQQDARTLQLAGERAIRAHQELEALAYLRAAVTLDPERAVLHRLLGIAYARIAEPEMSVLHYRTYIALDPQGSEVAQVEALIAAFTDQ